MTWVPAPGGNAALLLQEHALGQGVDLSQYTAGDVIRERMSILVPRQVPPGE